jgi:FAD/FMN-containing dehydrogenase
MPPGPRASRRSAVETGRGSAIDVGAVQASDLGSLDGRLRGEAVAPDHPEYDSARRVWNGIFDKRPAVVVRCVHADDVAAAIAFGREHDLVIAVRGGGHSLGGFSTCDDGLVIDLSGMRGVGVDPERKIARVLGGSLLSQLDEAAQEHGLVCPVGVVGHTGVGGLTLGGGMGRLQRHWGFSIDNMMALDVVTAAGERIHVSEDEHGDLFWGMRGAGPNFGVVTEFTFRLHEMATTITQGYLAFPDHRAHELAARLREYAPVAPDELMLSFAIGLEPDVPSTPTELAGRPAVYTALTHSGDLDDAEAAIRPLRDLGPVVDTVERRRYLDVQTSGDAEMAWGKRFYMKGGFLGPLSDEFVDAGVVSIASAPSAGCGITLWRQGGAIDRVPVDAMAFAGRDAEWWLGVEAEWDDATDDEAHVGWGRATMAALEPFTLAGHYVNDMIETGNDVVRSIYGPEKYERLVGLKHTYDPDNVFRMNQNIVP